VRTVWGFATIYRWTRTSCLMAQCPRWYMASTWSLWKFHVLMVPWVRNKRNSHLVSAPQLQDLCRRYPVSSISGRRSMTDRRPQARFQNAELPLRDAPGPW
jgi:hypothetical protein